MTNMFAAAKAVSKKAPTKKAKGKQKEEVAIHGMEDLARIDSAIKALDALKKTVEGDVKSQIMKHYVSKGMKDKKRPDTFTGTEGKATASCELRKRSVRSALNIEDRTLLDDHKIPYNVAVKVPGTFVINPEYAGDEKLLAAISEALENIEGVPVDFITYQEEVTTAEVTDETVDAVFQNARSAKNLARVLDVVSSLAVKAKTTEKVSDILTELIELVDED